MLSLSAEAAPQLSLDALDAACHARGLDGVELVLSERLLGLPSPVRGVRVVALRAAHIDERTAPALARASAELGVPVSVPPGVLDRPTLARVAPAFAGGGKLLIGHDTDLDEALAALAAIRAAGFSSALGLAWEIRPSSAPLVQASAVLNATRELLGLVRLHGGGPEQRSQDGRGVGKIFTELALSGYAGPIVLTPSGPQALAGWERWLYSTKPAGCGTAASEGFVDLDVRDVEPRHRLETILGAYRGLGPGGRLSLTVDHDPVCMYYTLEATEPAGSFTFEVREHGPEVWRAEVRKR